MKNNGQLTAILTGVAGQDGSYLAEHLLKEGYSVYGITRRKSVNQGLSNIRNLTNRSKFHLLQGDITDSTFMSRTLYDIRPHEFYNLAAMSNVGQSFAEPVSTFQVNASAVITQLELIRQITPSTRYYQASTSEMYGGLNRPKEGYDEAAPFHPRSPYAIAKAAAYYAVTNYREAYGLHASNGILFNHSSKRRGLDFATRKISHGIARVKLGLESHLYMGNLEAFRDEGCAEDYVKAMHLMLQQENPNDYIIATGECVSIEEMFRYVCELAKLNFEDVYRLDERFLRPSDVPYLLGNAKKARDTLGWSPNYTWRKLLKEMYENDLEALKKAIH